MARKAIAKKTIDSFDKLDSILTDVAPAPGVLSEPASETASNKPAKAIVLPEDDFMYVTELNLRRSVITGDLKHCKCVLPKAFFRALLAAGVSAGVTWDEVFRAVIAEQLSQPAPFASAMAFIPRPAGG